MRLRNSVSSASGKLTFGNGRIALLSVAIAVLSCTAIVLVINSSFAVMLQSNRQIAPGLNVTATPFTDDSAR
jgi:hypothetical protein